MNQKAFLSKLEDEGWVTSVDSWKTPIDEPFEFERLRCPECDSKNITVWPDSTGYAEIIICNDCGERIEREHRELLGQ